MLGSVADAEDVLQEAALRLHRADPRPDSEEAFLFRVVTNLCLDQLRREKVRRKHYFGPWLPDPWVHEDDASVDGADDGGDVGFEMTSIAQQLSLGFMLMLERLSPAERVVYVLREGFDFSYSEIAGFLSISTASARQRASRARARLKPETPDDLLVEPQSSAQKQMLTALIEAMAEADMSKLVSLMSDDTVVLTDGGGVVSAAIRPVTGAQRIAQVLLHLMKKMQTEGEVTFDYVSVNGGCGLLIRFNGQVDSVSQVTVRGGKLHRLYVMRNPHKLSHLH